eukprot:g15233.t1
MSTSSFPKHENGCALGGVFVRFDLLADDQEADAKRQLAALQVFRLGHAGEAHVRLRQSSPIQAWHAARIRFQGT